MPFVRDADVKQRQSHAHVRTVLSTPPIVRAPPIYLTGVDSGFGLSPSVIAASKSSIRALVGEGRWGGDPVVVENNGDIQVGWRADFAAIDALEADDVIRDLERHTEDVLLTSQVLPERLLRAAARYVFLDRGIPIDLHSLEEEVVAFPGTSLKLHDFALGEFLDAGKIILVPEPYFGPFTQIEGEATKLGQQLGTIPTRHTGYRLTARILEAAIQEHGRDRIGALLLTNPNNPTFQVMSREEMQSIADVIVAHQLPVLADELYAGLERPGRPHVSLASLRASDRLGGQSLHELVFTTSGSTKLFNLHDSNYRFGMGCSGNREWVARVRERIRDADRPFSQAAVALGTAALQFTDQHYKVKNQRLISDAQRHFRDALTRANRQLGTEAIVPLMDPQAGFYDCVTLAPELCAGQGIRNSDELMEYLWMCTGLATRPMSLMGTDQMGVRINVMGDSESTGLPTQTVLNLAVERLEQLSRAMIEGFAPSYETVHRATQEMARSGRGGHPFGSIAVVIFASDGQF